MNWAASPIRPEFAESTYFLFRATGDPVYLEVIPHPICFSKFNHFLPSLRIILPSHPTYPIYVTVVPMRVLNLAWVVGGDEA